ncbi:MAG: DUF192 domain-containing protein [Bacteroidia bacterium]|nr:DUF192 domain-containing protein [Bacteroidia bacterium]
MCRNKKYFIFSILSLILACTGNKEKQPDNSIPPRFVSPAEPRFKKEGNLSFIGSKTGKSKKDIDIEIADNENRQMQGLMYRKSMLDSQGMLFVFSKQQMQSFWMKNTFIPLDIIFADENGMIVTIQKNTTPLSEKSIPSFKPALYVVEVNAGFSDKYNIEEGDNIKFENN